MEHHFNKFKHFLKKRGSLFHLKWEYFFSTWQYFSLILIKINFATRSLKKEVYKVSTNIIHYLGDMKTLYDFQLVKKSAPFWASSTSSTMEKTFLPSLRFKEAQFVLNIIWSQKFVRIWRGMNIQKIGKPKLNISMEHQVSMISNLCVIIYFLKFCHFSLGQFS